MASLRSTLFGSKLRIALVLLVAVVGLVAAAFVTGILGVPGVDGVDNRFGEVTDENTTIETDLMVSNPNPIGIQLGGLTVNYTVSMNDISMAGGTKEGLSIGRGESTLNFTTLLDNQRIPPWWVSHIDNGERTQLRIDASIHSNLLGQSVSVPQTRSISTDIISQFNSSETRPVNAEQPLISDPVLYINWTGAAWGAVSQARTPINMEFVVYNPKTTPYTITEIGYDITMNGIAVGAGATEDPYTIPGHSRETIETTTAIENPTLDGWWVSHLHRNQITDLRIDFYARLELPTGDTVRIPLDALTYERRIETDIFGTKSSNESTDGGEETPDATRTATATATETDSSIVDTIIDDSTETASPTEVPDGSTPTATATPGAEATATPTQTATPTPTDDGGLLSLRHPGSLAAI